MPLQFQCAERRYRSSNCPAIATFLWLTVCFTLVTSLAAGCQQTGSGAVQQESNQNDSTRMTTPTNKDELAIATFGGGCFWCTEAIFLELKGVVSVKPGYAGGHVENPTYQAVCGGATGHAEVIQIEYDPQSVSYDKLLEVFFRTHDPTTLNRQGFDEGTQYRSVVFWHDEAQKERVEEIKKKLDEAGAYALPLVTEITKAGQFYVAEDYHQNYFNSNAGKSYCEAVIAPKIEKFRKVFAKDLKK